MERTQFVVSKPNKMQINLQFRSLEEIYQAKEHNLKHIWACLRDLWFGEKQRRVGSFRRAKSTQFVLC